MTLVLGTLAPLVLIVALGAILRRTGFTPAEFYKGTNRLVYWVGLPCLLFDKTSRGEAVGGEAMRVFAILLAATLACVILGYIVARLLRVPRRSTGAFVQASYRGNLAYVGLAVILFSIGDGDRTTEAIAALALAPLVPIYNLIAVVVLLAGHDHKGIRLARRLGIVAAKVLTNPLLLACVAGLLVSLSGWTLPPMVGRTCKTIGQMALPLALLGIGATLAFRHIRGSVGPAIAATAIKLLCAPLLGFAAATLLGASPIETRIALLFLACPTAIVAFVMAEQLGGDEQLTSGAIVLSTVCSIASMAAVLLLT